MERDRRRFVARMFRAQAWLCTTRLRGAVRMPLFFSLNPTQQIDSVREYVHALRYSQQCCYCRVAHYFMFVFTLPRDAALFARNNNVFYAVDKHLQARGWHDCKESRPAVSCSYITSYGSTSQPHHEASGCSHAHQARGAGNNTLSSADSTPLPQGASDSYVPQRTDPTHMTTGGFGGANTLQWNASPTAAELRLHALFRAVELALAEEG